MQLPPFDYRATSHAQVNLDERPLLDDGLISIAWNAGTLHVQYVGLAEVSKLAVDTVSDSMWQFATECQLMVILYASILEHQTAIRDRLGRSGDRATILSISEVNFDGTLRALWAQSPLGKVMDAFSPTGDFEKIFAKAFVLFAYQLWEQTTRPTIAQALGVGQNDVGSDLMGEWRYLRNWLVHPEEKTRAAYFENADMLARVLESLQEGNPEVTARNVFPLMGYLNSLHVIVNPNGLDPALMVTDLDSKIAEQISNDASESSVTTVPIWRRFKPPDHRQA